MYATSEEYKNKVYNASERHTLRVYINDVDIDSKCILECKSSLILFSNDSFSLGSVASMEVNLKLYKSGIPESIEKIYITSGIKDEEIPIGYFNVDSVSEDDFTITLKLLDNMIHFAFNYDGSALIQENGKASLKAVLEDICLKAGVGLGSTSFLNMDKEIAVYDNTVSARTYLSYIAEQAGGFATIGRDGFLYIKKIGQDISEIPLKYFSKPKWGEKFKITRVRYEDGVQLFEEGSIVYEKGEASNNTVYINQDNMFIVDQEQIDNIYDSINGLEIYGFTGESIIDPSLDVGDLLLIDGKYVIYQGSLQFNGKWKASINSKIQSKAQSESMTRTPSQKTVTRRIESKINQVEGTITTTAEKVDGVEKRTTTVEQSVSELTSSVVKQDELEDIKEEFKQTIEGATNTLTKTGGNNIFYYKKENWQALENESVSIEEFADTDVQQNSVSKLGYIVNIGTSIQKIQPLKDDTYTISFLYKKLNDLAIGQVIINNTTYELNGTVGEWSEFEKTIEVTTNAIDFRIVSDTADSFIITDLMGNIGDKKMIWTQNANETITDTVTIGKGIQVNSSTKNTYTRIDADGNRTFNASTGERVAEMTDKGVYANELEVKGNATINYLFIQKVENQSWITGI